MRFLFQITVLTLLYSFSIIIGQTRDAIITEADLAAVPIPIQRYLRFTRSMGKPFIARAEVTQSGQMKLKPDADWIPLHAEQWYDIPGTAFEWIGWVKAAPLFHVRARDQYKDGLGSLKIRLWGIIPMGKAEGQEANEGELMRYLSEIIWFPTAMLGENITWEAMDDTTARATITDHGVSVSGYFHVSPEGRVTAFTAKRYADMGDGTYKLADWYAPVYKYADFDGWYLPSEVSAIWL